MLAWIKDVRSYRNELLLQNGSFSTNLYERFVYSQMNLEMQILCKCFKSPTSLNWLPASLICSFLGTHTKNIAAKNYLLVDLTNWKSQMLNCYFRMDVFKPALGCYELWLWWASGTDIGLHKDERILVIRAVVHTLYYTHIHIFNRMAPSSPRCITISTYFHLNRKPEDGLWSCVVYQVLAVSKTHNDH